MQTEKKNTAIEPLLNLNEVAKILGVHRTKVSKYAREGDLPYIELGRNMRFLMDDVNAFIYSRRVGSLTNSQQRIATLERS